MSLEIYDGRGKHLDRFSSATGVTWLAESVAKRPKQWPLYHEFLQTGKILVTDELKAEIQNFIRIRRGKRNTLVRSISADLLATLEHHKPKRIWIGI
jgi:hypothetical protein